MARSQKTRRNDIFLQVILKVMIIVWDRKGGKMSLETIKQYEMRISREKQSAKEQAKRSGITCPDCETEMANMDGRIQRGWDVLKVVRCLSCGYETEVCCG